MFSSSSLDAQLNPRLAVAIANAAGILAVRGGRGRRSLIRSAYFRYGHTSSIREHNSMRSGFSVVPSPEVSGPRGQYHRLLVDPGKKWLVLSAHGAVAVDGTMPDGINAQTRLGWHKIKHLLGAADMEVANIVKVTSHLCSVDHFADFNVARAGILGEHKPTSTLLIVSGWAMPQFLIEIEVVAANEVRRPNPVRVVVHSSMDAGRVGGS